MTSDFQLFSSTFTNFAVLIVMACERGIGGCEGYDRIMGYYAKVLNDETYLIDMASALGEMYFGKHVNKPVNPMAEMMKMMMG